MSETIPLPETGLLDLVTDLVTAYVSNNSIPSSELSVLIVSVHKALSSLAGSAPIEAKTIETLTSAQIRKSITPDALISFEDGKSYKILRRHLTLRGLTPEGYRAKWGLPADYPMVAPNYSATRSVLARSFGLGQQQGGSGKDTQSIAAEAQETGAEASAITKPKGVGRPRKTVAAA